MNRQRSRDVKVGVERLEGRAVLSTLGLGHGGHALAAKSSAFRGSGTGNVVATTTNTDGSLTAKTAIAGSITTVGAFNGNLNISIPASGSSITGTAMLTDAANDTLILSLGGTYRPVKGSNKFSGSFVITGGTGAFASETGSGKFNGTANTNTEAASFTFTGKVIP